MHKDFYASGFLYNPQSQQILLQQPSAAEDNGPWGLLEDEVDSGSFGEQTFKDLVEKNLKAKLSLKKILYIYTRFANGTEKDHSIYYAEVKKLRKNIVSKKHKFAWFGFKQIHKLNLSEQTRHDIMVGQRVIDSATRKSLGQQTIG
jgi:hypothetical protein